MKNLPDVKMGIAAVSRDCFPIELLHIGHADVFDAHPRERPLAMLAVHEIAGSKALDLTGDPGWIAAGIESRDRANPRSSFHQCMP